jgi:hypothetical protein
LYEYRRHCDYLRFGGGCGGGNGLYSQAPQKRQVYRLFRQLCRLRRIIKQQKRRFKKALTDNKKGTVKTAVFTAPFFFNSRAYFFS